MNTIFVEFNSITKSEETYDWINNLTNEYAREVKDRGGRLRIVSDRLHGFDNVVVQIIEDNAYDHFKERSGKHRITVPIFDEKELTKQTGSRTLVIEVKVYPEAPNDFELQPKDISYRYVDFQEGRMQRVTNEYFYVELTHKPTGITTTATEERSKVTNKEMAEQILKAKLYQHQEQNNE